MKQLKVVYSGGIVGETCIIAIVYMYSVVELSQLPYKVVRVIYTKIA